GYPLATQAFIVGYYPTLAIACLVWGGIGSGARSERSHAVCLEKYAFPLRRRMRSAEQTRKTAPARVSSCGRQITRPSIGSHQPVLADPPPDGEIFSMVFPLYIDRKRT